MIKLEGSTIAAATILTLVTAWLVCREADAHQVPKLIGFVILTPILLISCSALLRRNLKRDPDGLDLEIRSRHYLLFYIPYFLIAKFMLASPEYAPPELLILYWFVMEESYFFAIKNLDSDTLAYFLIDDLWGRIAIFAGIGIIQYGPGYATDLLLWATLLILGLMILLPTRSQ